MARNVPTELILLQIAEGLQTLAKNPDLSQIIKDANALSEAEKAKADDARATIANADQLLSDLKKKEDALADIGTRIAEAEKLENFNADTLRDISKRQNELNTQTQNNQVTASDNEKERRRLEEWQETLEDREDAVKLSEIESGQIKAELKNRAEIMKAQTADL